MKRSILLAAALVASAAVSLEARDKQWKKGRIVNVESQMIAGNYERRLYYIDVGDDLIYVAWEKGSVTGSGLTPRP